MFPPAPLVPRNTITDYPAITRREGQISLVGGGNAVQYCTGSTQITPLAGNTEGASQLAAPGKPAALIIQE
jgi:hypothetical protein